MLKKRENNCLVISKCQQLGSLIIEQPTKATRTLVTFTSLFCLPFALTEHPNFCLFTLVSQTQ